MLLYGFVNPVTAVCLQRIFNLTNYSPATKRIFVMTNNNHSTVTHMTVWNKVFTLAQRFPQAYMAIIIPIALMGYAYLLFFPAMFVFSTGKFLWILGTTPTKEILAQTGSIVIWICIAVFSISITRQSMKIKFKPRRL